MDANRTREMRPSTITRGACGRTSIPTEADLEHCSAAKAKARGYRSLRNLIAIIYLIAGKIDLKLAT
jgi:hypothetical protein